MAVSSASRGPAAPPTLASAAPSRLVAAAFAAAALSGSFLLFVIEPLSGKLLLPIFGGTPAVWNACMLAFQVLLLGSYAYAHVVSTRLSPRAQVIVHGL